MAVTVRLGAVVACVVLAAVAVAPQPAAGILDPVDFLALQAVRRSLDDMPGSNFFDGWDFTADPCGFPGVFCDGDRVAALALGDPRAGSPGLTGRLDAALGRLSALTELSLVPGRVEGELPASLASCSSLRFLEAATLEAEEMEFEKLSAERELRQWRAEHEQGRAPGDTSSPRPGLAEISVLNDPGAVERRRNGHAGGWFAT